LRHIGSIVLVFKQRNTRRRLLASVALLLWCIALYAPFTAAYPSRNLILGDLATSEPVRGWVLALWGWFGPFFLAPGWYANIPFAISLYLYFTGRSPGRKMAIIGVILAATALGPVRDWSNIEDGAVSYYVRGSSLWLWLGACALVWVPV